MPPDGRTSSLFCTYIRQLDPSPTLIWGWLRPSIQRLSEKNTCTNDCVRWIFLDAIKRLLEVNDSKCEKLLRTHQDENGKHFPCEIGKILDNSSYRVLFYLDKKDKIYHYSLKKTSLN
jgi:hypothetical protein